MSRQRDDARKNMRREFALFHNDDEPMEVGSFSIGHADGCTEGFHEDGTPYWGDIAETHEPGSHDELHRVLVEPRRRMSRLERTR